MSANTAAHVDALLRQAQTSDAKAAAYERQGNHQAAEEERRAAERFRVGADTLAAQYARAVRNGTT